jgi:hypothetical protein
MNPKEIVQLKKQQPFQPFRIHLSDGRFYDVYHRDLIIVGPEVVHIGIPVPEHPRLLCEETEIVDLDAIAKLEPLVALLHITRLRLLAPTDSVQPIDS